MARIVISATGSQLPIGAQFERLADHLVAAGHDVVLLTFRRGAAGAVRLPDRPPDPRRMRWPSVEPTRLADAAAFTRLLRDFRPDCVIGQMSSVNWTMTLASLYRVPVRIAWYHFVARAGMIDEGQERFPLRARRRTIAYHCATRVVSSSEAARRETNEFYRVRSERSVVVHDGIDDGPVRAPRTDGGMCRLVTVGRLVRSKGIDVLIASLPSVGERCEVSIVGDGPERTNLEAMVDRLGLRDVVTFHGDIDHAAAMDVLTRADVLVHPSRMDNLPAAILEALRAGLPVVATAVGGVPETITDGVDGCLVPSDEPLALADAITSLVADPGLRARLGAAGRRRFEDEFRMAHFVTRATELIASELARGRHVRSGQR